MKTVDVEQHVQSLTKTARLINLLLFVVIRTAFFLLRVDFKVADRKVLPKKGPAIIVGAPHTSLADAVFLLASMRRTYAGIGMAELRTGDDWPRIVGKAFDLLGHIPVERSSRESSNGAYAEGLRVLDLGEALFVWPDGRQVAKGQDVKWFDGFARFALETGAPIYVYKIDGADDFWPTNPNQGGPQKINFRAKIRARFTGPIDLTGSETVDEIVQETKRTVAELPLAD